MNEAAVLKELTRQTRNLVDGLAPKARKKLLSDVSRRLRKSTQQRMAKQINPDGSKWEPRKRDSNGSIRSRAKMMTELRKVRRLKATAKQDRLSLGFYGSDARIAHIHHRGLRDRPDPEGREIVYPERQILGITNEDSQMIEDMVLEHLTG
ncbi:phage virion morphogenesis protein [Kiloniella sp. b19]|uniref:phage virion morphogenesis protein n=1 Tax=Kiloniella sp. GXU_MW_B19 TaxID=3141326 RepID=UPI0031D7160C